MSGEAKTKIVIDVGEGAKSLRTLKQEFKETQKVLDSTIVGTKEYTAAIKKLANVKDEIEDLNKEITAFRPDQKLASFVGAARGIAAGFEAATAASALFGAESKDVEKALLKVQAAMALSNAIQEVGELGKAFKLFGQVAKAAIGSTGIGLLLIAIGAIAAYWDQIKSSITGVSSEMENELAISKKVVDIEKEKLSHIEKQANIMKLNGVSEKQILLFKQAATKEAILAMEIDLKKNQAVQKVQEETAQRNKEILQGILRFIELPITAILFSVDKLGQAFGKDWKLEEKFSGGIAKLVFDPDKINEEGVKANKETQKQIDELKDKQVQYQLAVQDIDKNAYKKSLDDLDKYGEERFKKFKEQRDREIAEQKAIDEWEDSERKRYASEKATEDDAQAASDAEKLNASLQQYQENKSKELQVDADALGTKAQIRKAIEQIEQASFSSLSSLGQIFINDSQKLAQFQKGLAVTQIAIDTAKAISSTIAGATAAATATGPAAPFTLVAYIASGIATVLANVAKAKQLLESVGAPSVPSLGVGSVGGSSIRPPQLNPVSNTSTNLADIQNGSGNRTMAPVKAYVIETDSTSAQKRVARIEERTKF